MKVFISDSVTVVNTEDKYIFINERKRIKIKKSYSIVKFVEELIKYNSIDIKLEKDKEIDYIVNVLMKNKILLKKVEFNKDINRCNLLYLNHFVDNPELEMERIIEKQILIIGMGGVGQIIIQHLAASGFRKFIVVDYDCVNEDNFNRQFLIRKNQIGRKKIDSIKDSLRESIEDLQIKTIDKKIEEDGDLDVILKDNNVDIIICSADYPINIIDKIIVEESIKFGIPCAFCSVGLVIGGIGPILDTIESKKNYLTCKNSNIDIIYNPVLSGSICFTNTMVSVILAHQIFKYFSKCNEVSLINREILLDIEKLNVISSVEY